MQDAINEELESWKQHNDLTAPIITNDFGKTTKCAKK
jgi:hypothetical protein